ncbi:FGGY carbohydrate kinase domain-containing protein-like isoform X1 [Artemia franciscana]|uniref:FGGY carbohydrate kinase domain-containing protein-like isoform X1 n=1 Tax=Artemia franciscana TaxID=6661 RepID=UPI0032DB91CD
MYYIGIDVGTGSVRACLSNYSGKIIKYSSHPLTTWSEYGTYFMQSTENIWNSVVLCIKDVVDGVSVDKIKGIGFDATCSLAVVDANHDPVTVCPFGNKERNVILWMDHRAVGEAEHINSMKHEVLDYVGGKMSPEMEMPKLLWLKKNVLQSWEKIGKIFDLPDFLTWKATGDDSRSLCSLVCKWGFLCRNKGDCNWSASFLKEIGLSELLDNDCYKIGSRVLAPGHPVGMGLTESVANEVGLIPGTPVATSIIDAHAGVLGMIGCNGAQENMFEKRLGIVCVTSSCHMCLSTEPKFIKGVWGPYFGAIIDDYWLNEAGQSATGKLIDHIIESHPAYETLNEKIPKREIYAYLEDLLEKTAVNVGCSLEKLVKDLHVYPDFHGNRSPLADPDMKGMIIGLTLAKDELDLAKLYLATLQGLAYGTRHIIESLISGGYNITEIVMCGGLVKSKLFVQTNADAIQVPVLLPEENESVLLGSAILARVAAGHSESLAGAIMKMSCSASSVTPNVVTKRFHDAKYDVFRSMLDLQRRCSVVMSKE